MVVSARRKEKGKTPDDASRKPVPKSKTGSKSDKKILLLGLFAIETGSVGGGRGKQTSPA